MQDGYNPVEAGAFNAYVDYANCTYKGTRGCQVKCQYDLYNRCCDGFYPEPDAQSTSWIHTGEQWRKCSVSGRMCPCDGTAMYGRSDSVDGSEPLTIDQMRSWPNVMKRVKGSIFCHPVGFGRDPLPNVRKACMCLPSPTPSPPPPPPVWCNKCARETCPAGEYRTGTCDAGTSTNTYRCNPCDNVTCEPNHYRVGVCTGTTNGYQCRPCDNDKCAFGVTYRTGVCKNTLNGFRCEPCANRECQKDQWRVGECSGQ